MIAAGDRDLVAAEAAPDLLPVAARLDLDLAELGPGLDRDRAGEAGAAAEDLPARSATRCAETRSAAGFSDLRSLMRTPRRTVFSR